MAPKLHFYILFFLLTYSCFSQSPKKTLTTTFSKERITIDGKFDEEIWRTAQIATDFVMLNPDNGRPELAEKKSEVKLVYTNDALYVAAFLHDNEPEKITRELTLRDNFGNADHFGVFINGYNDGQQEFRFFVSAAGVQQDVLYTNQKGEDFTWNAIWDSRAVITDQGWMVEMEIPYAALRFPTNPKQTWGLDFYREIRGVRQQFSWNYIDNKIATEANQAGILEGIENIKPPTRLFLFPYASFYLNNDVEKTQGELKGGLDIKYGINDAFTLDAILVPDFGQTAFDKVELNLGPFEQQFSENRPFFTEGTELFSKGNLVYSRRIGGSPSVSPEVGTDEEITEYPEFVNLLNALKISGRTKKGLGIGFLNAITQKTNANIRNTVTGEERTEVIEPLANYNIFVLDQRFNKNSSVSFVNTSVLRNGEFRDANVSAALFDLNTKKNTYNLSGDYKFSHINAFGQPDTNGYSTSLNLKETSGKYRFSTGGQYVSNNYDINDLGINFLTHYHSVYANASYRILNPVGNLNAFSVSANQYGEFDNRTGRVQNAYSSINFNLTTKKRNDYYGLSLQLKPLEMYDFYEAQGNNEERFVVIPSNHNVTFTYSSNYARKFAIDVRPTYTFFNERNRSNYGFLIAPRYRFSNRVAMIYEFSFNQQDNNIGWIANNLNDVVFTRRDRTTFSNTLTGKYTVSNTMNINLSLRHYSSYALNKDILNLQEDGSLTDNTTYLVNKNSNFNSWNFDLSYSWWFAPGSQVSVLYRNYANNFEREFSTDYATNIRNLINNDRLTHSFSISIRYFIDYNSLR